MIAVDGGAAIAGTGQRKAACGHRLGSAGGVDVLGVIGCRCRREVHRIAIHDAGQGIIARRKRRRPGPVIGLGDRSRQRRAHRDGRRQRVEEAVLACRARNGGGAAGRIILLEVMHQAAAIVRGRIAGPDQEAARTAGDQRARTGIVGKHVAGDFDRSATGRRGAQDRTGIEGDARVRRRAIVDDEDRIGGDRAERDVAAFRVRLAGAVAQRYRHRARPGIDAGPGGHRNHRRAGIALGIDHAIGEKIIGDQRDIAPGEPGATARRGADVGIEQERAARLQGQRANRRGRAGHTDRLGQRDVVGGLQGHRCAGAEQADNVGRRDSDRVGLIVGKGRSGIERNGQSGE